VTVKIVSSAVFWLKLFVAINYVFWLTFNPLVSI